MADFSIDYSALHTVSDKMHTLADTASSGGGTGVFKEMGEAGSSANRDTFGSANLSRAFDVFYRYSSSRTQDAEEGLNELADTFESVADTFFDADAELASSAGLMGTSMGLDEWKDQKETYEQWESDKATWDAYLEEIGASEYFEEHPDAEIGEVCSADGAPDWCDTWLEDDDAPDDPGEAPEKPSDEPPTTYSYEDESGKVDVTLELDEDYNVMKETSTITTASGQSYTSVTEYQTAPQEITLENGETFDARDYTMTTTYADGSESVTTVVINEDGSGTMTTDDGEETTAYTRSAPDADWVETEGDDE